MNKEALSTILGVAGLSLLKKVSGSNSKSPKNRFGTIFFTLKPYSDELNDEYDHRMLFYDFYSILVDYKDWNKKYGRMSERGILLDNGIELEVLEDETAGTEDIFPEGEARFVENVLEDNFEFASSIQENWYPVYAIDTDIFRILKNMSRGFLSVELLDDSIILEVNVVQLVESLNSRDEGEIKTIEDLLNYIKDYVDGSINSVCYVLGDAIYNTAGLDVDVGCTVEMIDPSNKLWLPILLAKKDLRIKEVLNEQRSISNNIRFGRYFCL